MTGKYLAALILALSITGGCGGRDAAVQGGIVIATSFYPMYLHTINIAGGVPGVTVVNITPPMTGCLHDYQLAPADLARLEGARMFVVNGAGMESFLDRVVKRVPGLAVIDASRGIELIKSADGSDNPHVWVSVTLAIRQVNNIAAQMSAVDPDRAEQYLKNARTYTGRLEKLRTAMHTVLDPLPKRPVATFHEAFPYLAREFGITVSAVIEREPGIEPSAGEMAAIIGTVRKRGVRVIYAEPQYPARSAEVIARETEARVYTLDPIVTGPPDRDAYLAIMKRNLVVLRETLR
jgi:zinc transport system substrate-binding protein